MYYEKYRYIKNETKYTDNSIDIVSNNFSVQVTENKTEDIEYSKEEESLSNTSISRINDTSTSNNESKFFLYDTEYKDFITRLIKFFNPKTQNKSKNKDFILIIRSFFHTVYNYFQIINSELMKYKLNSNNNNDNNKEENEEEDDEDEDFEFKKAKELVDVPFACDLTSLNMEGKYSYVILSPIRIEPKVENCILIQNNLKEIGLYESGNMFLFNN